MSCVCLEYTPAVFTGFTGFHPALTVCLLLGSTLLRLLLQTPYSSLIQVHHPLKSWRLGQAAGWSRALLQTKASRQSYISLLTTVLMCGCFGHMTILRTLPQLVMEIIVRGNHIFYYLSDILTAKFSIIFLILPFLSYKDWLPQRDALDNITMHQYKSNSWVTQRQ